MRKRKYLCSVSGGRSSVMMMKLLIDKEKLTAVPVVLGGFSLYTKYVNATSEYIFVFCNTSREKEETLIFLDEVEKYWGVKITWLEAIVDFRKNKGTKHRVISFDTAVRDGGIFEAVIQKYGIPNSEFLHCTREMKTVTARSFMRWIGWGDYKKYTTILGFRADEPKRVNLEKAELNSQWYPLWEWGMKKPDVAYYWNRQPFDLGIEVDADGNCELCYKKSDLKLIYQVRKNPNGSEWIVSMENKYGNESCGRSMEKAPFRFFRHNRTLQEVIDQYPELKDKSLEELKNMLNDKSLSEDGANFDLYEQEECADSCEPFMD
jgi:3'-phosphoadenosine 5'-phosphosulfate sulfotransferase (PAPS reductase)/FAD synthetase